MIKIIFSKAEIAFRYYEGTYDREAARKQFNQDKNIDKKELRIIMDKLYSEQKALIKES